MNTSPTTLPQVSAECRTNRTNEETGATFAPDLRKRPDSRRPWLLSLSDRLKKLATETSFYGEGCATAHDPVAAIRTYAGIMTAPRFTPVSPDQITDTLRYLLDEDLITIDRGEIVPLGDPQREKGIQYPGMPGGVHPLAGTRLAALMTNLIPEAMLAITSGKVRVHMTRAERLALRDSPGRARLSARHICEAINLIKRKRADLTGYRWASITMVRRWIRTMRDSGLITQLIAAVRSRRKRMWVTAPPVYDMTSIQTHLGRTDDANRNAGRCGLERTRAG